MERNPLYTQPSPEQEAERYHLLEAALWDEVIELGGVTAEQAQELRTLALGRIGMGKPVYVRKYEDREDPW